MTQYYRIKLSSGRCVWATGYFTKKTKIGWIFSITVCDKEGEGKAEIILGTKADILWVKTATMNLKYGWLEKKGPTLLDESK